MPLLRSLKKAVPQRHPMRLFWHKSKAFLAATLNGFPARKLTVIAVTGTDGKTTTVSMIAHILAESGIRVGALSTAFLRIGERIEWNTTQKTSPSPFLIQRFLRRCRGAKCTHVVLEASSHGLVQGRLHWTWPAVAAVTNITPEHLDYHGTMERYRADKGILFQMLRGRGTKVLNRDDASFPLFSKIPSAGTLTFSGTSEDADFSSQDIMETAQGVKAVLRTSAPLLPLSLKLIGTFNVENALCAIACAHACDIGIEQAARSLASFPVVPGRLERIDEGQPFRVYVDFTVTPAAYEKTLTTLRRTMSAGQRLLVLTGSCGDRMREKRPQVGRLCSELADEVVVTNEDPYTEDPRKIIDEVFGGIDQHRCSAHRIFDRREAMSFLFGKAQLGDVVILCAKGADTTMMTARGQIPWNEREIARELLRNLKRDA